MWLTRRSREFWAPKRPTANPKPTSAIWPNWLPHSKTVAIKSRSVLLHGPNPAVELVNYLRHDPVDLLVVGSHGHGLVRDLLLGQTVDKVRHSLGVPMLIARPDRAGPAGISRSRDLILTVDP